MAYGVSIEEAKRAIDELVQCIEQKFKGFNISEIVKGGSMGHGTTVPGHFDIDLVIYSRDISGQQVLDNGRSQFQPWLRKLHAFLSNALGHTYNYKGMTRRSVQFNYKGQVDVDLLVSPYWDNPHSLYRFLKSVPEDKRDEDKRDEDKCDENKRDTFTVCASKWQVELFKSKPNEVKEYIRRAKAWRNKKWPEDQGGEGRPSSYLMSLLVLRAYETKGYRTITQSLKDLVAQSMDVCWETYYKRRDYPNLLPSRPRLVDPANPANNVWISGFKKCNPRERISDYEPGDGNSSVLRRLIHTIDLSQPI